MQYYYNLNLAKHSNASASSLSITEKNTQEVKKASKAKKKTTTNKIRPHKKGGLKQVEQTLKMMKGKTRHGWDISI